MHDEWKKRPRLPRQPTKPGEPPGWYSRGYLPHFDGGEIAQTVNFRLVDSLPQALLNQWRKELSHRPKKEAEPRIRRRIEAYLDKGMGSAWMKRPEVADEVENSLLYFDAERYRIQAWVVMPNHVHALLTPISPWKLGGILHSWKSYTANKCNKLVGESEEYWQTETFDRYVRDERHYHNAIRYIENNPVKAGLCKKPEDWKWSSAWRRKKKDE